jgi:4'-phosphopantetheinyl transferase
MALAALPQSQWLQGFFRCWTRKEAVIKALGLGLSLELAAFDVSVAPDVPPALLRLAGEADASVRWSILDASRRSDVVVAVAARSEGRYVLLRDIDDGQGPAIPRPHEGDAR